MWTKMSIFFWMGLSGRRQSQYKYSAYKDHFQAAYLSFWEGGKTDLAFADAASVATPFQVTGVDPVSQGVHPFPLLSSVNFRFQFSDSRWLHRVSHKTNVGQVQVGWVQGNVLGNIQASLQVWGGTTHAAMVSCTTLSKVRTLSPVTVTWIRCTPSWRAWLTYRAWEWAKPSKHEDEQNRVSSGSTGSAVAWSLETWVSCQQVNSWQFLYFLALMSACISFNLFRQTSAWEGSPYKVFVWGDWLHTVDRLCLGSSSLHLPQTRFSQFLQLIICVNDIYTNKLVRHASLSIFRVQLFCLMHSGIDRCMYRDKTEKQIPFEAASGFKAGIGITIYLA